MEEEEEPTLEDLLSELNALVGLDKVKEEVRTMVNLARIRKMRKDRGLCQTEMCRSI